MTQYTVYHNPDCPKSRAAMDLLARHGIQPTVVEYLGAPPDENQLTHLMNLLNCSLKELLRTKEPIYKELGLDQPKVSEETILAAVLAHPILLERPIIVSANRAVIARPTELLEEFIAAQGA